MKRWIAIVLCLCMVIPLASCGKESRALASNPVQEQAAVPSAMSPEEQIQRLFSNSSLWKQEEFNEYDPYYYTVTDLDHNGRVEILAAITQGTGIFTSGKVYEMAEGYQGIQDLTIDFDEETMLPEIIVAFADGCYDPSTDTYYYLFENVTRAGAAEHGLSKEILSIKDGKFSVIPLAWSYHEYDAETMKEYAEYSSPTGTITEAEFSRVFADFASDMERMRTAFDWFTFHEGDSAEKLLHSYRVFIGTEKPLVPLEEFIPVEAEIASVSSAAPVSTLAPTAEPVSVEHTPSPGNIVITKNPSSESLAIGGKTWFIAHAQNASALTWQLVDPNGTVYSIENAMEANPGLLLEALEGDTIAVGNVPASMNGWGIQAVFSDGPYSASTEPAYIFVGDYVSAYSSVIERYRNYFYSANKSPEQAFNQNVSEWATDCASIGYALKDLDKDSIPELIVVGFGEYLPEKMILEIDTLKGDGLPTQLCQSQARDKFYLRTDSRIYEQGSGGAAYAYLDVFQWKEGGMLHTESLRSDLDEKMDSIWLYSPDGIPEHEVQISEQEAYNRIDTYESLLYLPQVTQIR